MHRCDSLLTLCDLAHKSALLVGRETFANGEAQGVSDGELPAGAAVWLPRPQIFGSGPTSRGLRPWREHE